MRFSLDTNILFYTFDAADVRRDLAVTVVRRAMLADCVVTNQVLGEFLNAVRRRHRLRSADAADAVVAWSVTFPVVRTATAQLLRACLLAASHRLQFWDSVILTVAADAGAQWLLTEDIQDGAVVGGVRILNPFDTANAEALDLLLTPAP